MFETQINVLAVLIAAVATMGVGFAWYSPLLFGKPWMKLMGITAKSMQLAKKSLNKIYGISFVATLITGYVLAIFVNTIQALTLSEAISLGGLVWLGFVAPVQLTDVLFGGKQWRLFCINTGYQLASIIVMSIILVFWI
jgi:hypothetical protein